MSCKLIPTVDEMKSIAQKYQDLKVGFVPTMGALHEGHISLISQAIKQSDVVVVSIFVNPTQFNNPNDFETYPNRVAEDIAKLKALNVDYLFLPTADEMYPNGYHYKISENMWSHGLCGDTRPGHFDGVLTVLMKLFNLVKPTKVFMGLKDYQQWKLVSGMCQEFFMELEVVGVPTIRTAEGLAMSSRNLNLKPEQLEKANKFAQIFRENKSLTEIRRDLELLNLKIDYLEERWGRRFVAVFLDNVRLIDNVEIIEGEGNAQSSI